MNAVGFLPTLIERWQFRRRRRSLVWRSVAPPRAGSRAFSFRDFTQNSTPTACLRDARRYRFATRFHGTASMIQVRSQRNRNVRNVEGLTNRIR
jgi:hypothetical protein